MVDSLIGDMPRGTPLEVILEAVLLIREADISWFLNWWGVSVVRMLVRSVPDLINISRVSYRPVWLSISRQESKGSLRNSQRNSPICESLMLMGFLSGVVGLMILCSLSWMRMWAEVELQSSMICW